MVQAKEVDFIDREGLKAGTSKKQVGHFKVTFLVRWGLGDSVIGE